MTRKILIGLGALALVIAAEQRGRRAGRAS